MRVFGIAFCEADILHINASFIYTWGDMRANEKVELKGITWDHSRGFTPLVATAQRFHELHPEIEIIWSKRSLQGFADMSIEQLAARFDLIVIDHPWAGFAGS